MLYIVRRGQFVEVHVGVSVERFVLDSPVLSGFCQVRCFRISVRYGVTSSVSWVGDGGGLG